MKVIGFLVSVLFSLQLFAEGGGPPNPNAISTSLSKEDYQTYSTKCNSGGAFAFTGTDKEKCIEFNQVSQQVITATFAGSQAELAYAEDEVQVTQENIGGVEVTVTEVTEPEPTADPYDYKNMSREEIQTAGKKYVEEQLNGRGPQVLDNYKGRTKVKCQKLDNLNKDKNNKERGYVVSSIGDNMAFTIPYKACVSSEDAEKTVHEMIQQVISSVNEPIGKGEKEQHRACHSSLNYARKLCGLDITSGRYFHIKNVVEDIALDSSHPSDIGRFAKEYNEDFNLTYWNKPLSDEMQDYRAALCQKYATKCATACPNDIDPDAKVKFTSECKTIMSDDNMKTLLSKKGAKDQYERQYRIGAYQGGQQNNYSASQKRSYSSYSSKKPTYKPRARQQRYSPSSQYNSYANGTKRIPGSNR